MFWKGKKKCKSRRQGDRGFAVCFVAIDNAAGVLQYVLSQSITPLGFYTMFCSWGTRPAEVPKGARGRSGRKVADPNTTHNAKVVHFGRGSGRQPGRGSGTVARGGPGRGRREVVEEAREDIRESTTTTTPTTRRRRRRRGRFKILSFVCAEVGLRF